MIDLESQKEALLQLQRENEYRAQRLDGHQRRAYDELEQDSSERAVQLENDEVIDKLDEQAHDMLEKIKVALDRIAQGTYELCGMCEEPIGEARLVQIPYATHCVSCQQETETSA